MYVFGHLVHKNRYPSWSVMDGSEKQEFGQEASAEVKKYADDFKDRTFK